MHPLLTAANNKPALLFDGTNDRLDLPYNFTFGTLFAVVKYYNAPFTGYDGVLTDATDDLILGNDTLSEYFPGQRAGWTFRINGTVTWTTVLTSWHIIELHGTPF